MHPLCSVAWLSVICILIRFVSNPVPTFPLICRLFAFICYMLLRPQFHCERSSRGSFSTLNIVGQIVIGRKLIWIEFPMFLFERAPGIDCFICHLHRWIMYVLLAGGEGLIKCMLIGCVNVCVWCDRTWPVCMQKCWLAMTAHTADSFTLNDVSWLELRTNYNDVIYFIPYPLFNFISRQVWSRSGVWMR